MKRVLVYDASLSARYDRRYQEHDSRGIEQALLQFLAAPEPRDALEVGCGTGHWLAFLAGRTRGLVGLDPSADMLARARAAVPEARLVRGRAEALPWPDGAFDRAFCVNALHHFRDRAAFFAEARRVLRPGGAVLSVGLDPHTGHDRWWIYDYFPVTVALDRERYVPASAIRAGLAAAGFARAETRQVQHIERTVSVEAAEARGFLDRTSTSQLAILSDAEYAEGLRRIADTRQRAAERNETVSLLTDLRLYATGGWID